jgi:RimJ/RimL family protein N-acetyltransferase
MQSLPELRTRRLHLRPLGAGDDGAVVAGLSDLAVAEWLADVPHPFQPRDAAELRQATPSVVAVVFDGALIGAVSVGAHFGFWIARTHWGQGFGTEAASASIALAMQGRARVDSCYFAGNSASARILTRLGFTITGRGRSYCRALDRMRPSVSVARATTEGVVS